MQYVAIASLVAAVYFFLKNGPNGTLPNVFFQAGQQPGIKTGFNPVAVTSNPASSNSNVVTDQPGTSASGVPSSSQQTRAAATRIPGFSINNNQPFYGNRNRNVAIPKFPNRQNTSSGCGCGSSPCGGHQDGRGGCSTSPAKPCGCGGAVTNPSLAPSNGPLSVRGQLANFQNYAELGASPFNAWQQAHNDAAAESGSLDVPAAPTYIH